jgi:PleD family two-component response regulator
MQISGSVALNPFTSSGRGNEGEVSILVVGDDPRVMEAMKVVLEKMGKYNVLVACSGAECLHQVEEVQPALVLLEMHMSQVDGLEVLRQLRAQPESCELPVLMISVDAQFEQMVACFEAGASGFLIKPFDAASLYQQVRTAIAQHGVGLLQRDAR